MHTLQTPKKPIKSVLSYLGLDNATGTV
jgi:hypothetical protein